MLGNRGAACGDGYCGAPRPPPGSLDAKPVSSWHRDFISLHSFAQTGGPQVCLSEDRVSDCSNACCLDLWFCSGTKEEIQDRQMYLFYELGH